MYERGMLDTKAKGEKRGHLKEYDVIAETPAAENLEITSNEQTSAI